MISDKEMHNMARILRANFTQKNLDDLQAYGYTKDQVQEFMDFISTDGSFKTPDLVRLMANCSSWLFRDYYIAHDGSSIYLAEAFAKRYDEDGSEDRHGHYMKRDRIHYLGKFNQAAWQLMTDNDHEEFFMTHTKEEIVECGWPKYQLDILEDMLTHKVGFIPFALGKIPFKDFPLRAVDWMMIPATKMDDLAPFYNMRDPKDIVNTTIYAQLFFINWIRGHVIEGKWDPDKIDEKIPNFSMAASLVADHPGFDYMSAYKYAYDNLSRIMAEREKGKPKEYEFERER